MVSAFAARQRLVLGQVKVAEKSNEIVAIPKILDMLAIEGAIVTIDAMGCQRDIARAVIDKKAGLRPRPEKPAPAKAGGNQGSLRDDVDLFVAEQKARGFADTRISQDTTVDGDHGRIETRTTTVIHDVRWLQERHDRPGLKAVVIVESRREISGKIEQETRYYITSLAMLAVLLGPVIRSHWAVENSRHWVMDMVFRDDECRARTDHAAANFTTIKHMAFNLLRRPAGKQSLRGRRNRRNRRRPAVVPVWQLRLAAAGPLQYRDRTGHAGADFAEMQDEPDLRVERQAAQRPQLHLGTPARTARVAFRADPIPATCRAAADQAALALRADAGVGGRLPLGSRHLGVRVSFAAAARHLAGHDRDRPRPDVR
jgi:predicted transposase YbfD/YdcC